MNKTMQALPIANFRDRIVEAVKSHDVVIVTAETGAGKSTQVPQYLLDAGYDMIVTQPRRLATRAVAARVAEEIGEELGQTVGYRTAVDRQDGPATRCLFCTDGLALVRELIGANKGILVLDEVHEWNENMEVLVAWAKKQVKLGCDFKVVIMSATLEAEVLAAFFDGAPIISVPGRLYPVTQMRYRIVRDDSGYYMAETTIALDGTITENRRLMNDKTAARWISIAGYESPEVSSAWLATTGHNVLAFQPGKSEINETIAMLTKMEVAAEILPLHGELTPEEQNRCFKHYGRPKVVVSTNVAQTSVTIDDIDAVVDSGLERRIELSDGVEGLYIKPISLADAKQREGRAGRTKEGIYTDHCPSATRIDFPVAEIMRKRLDQTVLRLAIAGFDMEDLEFFHQPRPKRIQKAKESLIRLGCMTIDGVVTAMGRQINRLPISVKFGRMLVEANKHGVVDDVLTAAAIMEQGGIVVPTPSRTKPNRPDWRRMVPDEHTSDVLGQLAVYKMAATMSKEDMREKGVSIRAYHRAKEIRQQLAKAVAKAFRFGSTGDRDAVLKSISAGMIDHLYRDHYAEYRNGDGVDRRLGQSSLVCSADWLVGEPFDLEVETGRGKRTLYLIEMASKVDPMWLAEIAPQLVEFKTGLNPRYDSEKDMVVSTTETWFNGAKIKEETVDDLEHEEAATVFARWLSQRSSLEDSTLDEVLCANSARQVKAKELNMRVNDTTFKVYSSSEIYELYRNALVGVRRVAEVTNPTALAMPELDADLVESVLQMNPDSITVLGKTFPVHYSSCSAPSVIINFVDENLDWRELPDDGVFLPSGREVGVGTDGYSIKSMVGGSNWRVGTTASSGFKAKVREALNNEQWEKHQKPEPPTITADSELTDLPLMEAMEYGRDALTDEPLIYFGTVMVNKSRYWSSDPYFKPFWSGTWTEVEDAWWESRQRLIELKALLNKK